MPYKVLPIFYTVWADMKQRCNNPKDTAFRNYGGRGIKVCERWDKSYKAFEADMGERPHKYELDRIDTEGDYTPENCRWISHQENLRNRRNTVCVTIEGTEYKLCELSEKYGVERGVIVGRVNRGLSFDDVVSTERFYELSGLALGAAAKKAAKQAETHCKNGHEYSDENTRRTKQGWRVCMDCRAMYAKKRHVI